MIKKTTIKRNLISLSISALACLSIGCDGGKSAFSKLGAIQEKSLSLEKHKLDNLSSCTFDNDCRNNEVCSILDLKSGSQKKCVEPVNICRDASCAAGECVALSIGAPNILNQPGPGTTVTCVDGGDQTNGLPGSSPGNSGSGAVDPVFELVIADLKNLVSTATSFSVEAKLVSSNESIRVVVNQSTGSQCQVEAVRAHDDKKTLTVLGKWKTLKVSGFAGDTYQFSQADFCFSGQPQTNMPEI